jgi:hypothetical protein
MVVQAPRTRARVRAVRNGRLRVEQTEFELSHLALTWSGPAAQVRIRTGGKWSRWETVDGCTGGKDGGTADGGHSALLLAPEASGYEVWVAGEGTGEVTELNTLDAAVGALATATPAASMPLPDGSDCAVPYLSRSAWGANEAYRTWGEDGYYAVQTITVHHSATRNADPDPAATIRAIYYDQAVTKGWGDVGYHLFIDEAGRVYEARWSGSDGVPAFRGQPGADGRPLLSTGAHIEHYNSGNLGICLLGNFTSQLPTAAARNSLVRVLADLTRVCDLDPLGSVTYVNPADPTYTKSVKVIPGHRDFAATACPGDYFYPQLPAVRNDVAELRAQVVYRRTWTARPITPRRSER